jgi:GAF domain-containing protein
MDEPGLLGEVHRVLDGDEGRERKAAGVAAAIRRAAGYRWVGIYEVTEEEIAKLAFDGPGAPAHPRFPVTQGLSGAAVASKETVVAGDVSEDPGYLTTFGSTRSEMIVPVLDQAGKVVGTIDIESEEVDALSEGRPRRPGALRGCRREAFRGSPGSRRAHSVSKYSKACTCVPSRRSDARVYRDACAERRSGLGIVEDKGRSSIDDLPRARWASSKGCGWPCEVRGA